MLLDMFTISRQEMLRLHYDELVGKVKKHEEEKYLMIDDYMLHRVLSKIKKITSIEKFGDNKILIDTDDKLPNNITLKNCVI